MNVEINKKKELQQLEQAAKLSTYTTEPSRRFNYFYDDDDEESSIPLREIISELPPSIVITPVSSSGVWEILDGSACLDSETSGGNTRNLGSILEETGQEYDFTPKEGLKNTSQMVETVSRKLATSSGSASDRVGKSWPCNSLHTTLLVRLPSEENANTSSPTHSNEFLDLEKKLEFESWLENSRSVDSLVSSDNELEDEIAEVKEEEEEDLEYFDILPTMKELGYHEWLLKNPRPSWVKAKIRTGSLDNIKISCMIAH
ncbi:hypothetical protein Tco_0870587 [Tanacetum coccineum]